MRGHGSLGHACLPGADRRKKSNLCSRLQSSNFVINISLLEVSAYRLLDITDQKMSCVGPRRRNLSSGAEVAALHDSDRGHRPPRHARRCHGFGRAQSSGASELGDVVYGNAGLVT
jgi:hypothetical protein